MISSLFIGLSWIFLLIGVAGLFRLEGVFTRLLSSSKLDSVTVITLMIGLMLRTGWSPMTGKLIVILMFYLLTNPITSQIIASAAWQNGIKPDRVEERL